MKLVIDTNKIMAAMIKDSLSRRIISTPMFHFVTPDYTLQELSKYENTIRKKAKLTHQGYQRCPLHRPLSRNKSRWYLE